MKRATVFMAEEVSYEGGYVWSYLPDFSRRWGEMEAYPTMIWIQPPGTPGMGTVLLDAYRATHDDYYYEAACRAADALIRAQHPSGGWNYVADFAGEDSLRRWYNTIGHNGWRLEEFHRYDGNATFDDRTTTAAARFLLQLYLEKRDPRYRTALDRAIQFVLDAQYACGGWPQRYPFVHGTDDYSSFLTFNDDVAVANLDFLIECQRALGQERLQDPILRGMNAFLITQQPATQAGWAMQYTPELEPAAARSYEPKALSPETTAQNIAQLLRFYQITHDKKFLTRIPEAFDWLDSVRFSVGREDVRGTHPTFVEIGSNEPLFVHRVGSNVRNGRYYADDDPKRTIAHYSSFRTLYIDQLQDRYQAILAMSPDQLAESSPADWWSDALTPDRMNRSGGSSSRSQADRVERIIRSLNEAGYWPSQLRLTSHPYHDNHEQPGESSSMEFSESFVGDDSDTSPYLNPQPTPCISVSTYIANMETLMGYLRSME